MRHALEDHLLLWSRVAVLPRSHDVAVITCCCEHVLWLLAAVIMCCCAAVITCCRVAATKPATLVAHCLCESPAPALTAEGGGGGGGEAFSSTVNSSQLCRYTPCGCWVPVSCVFTSQSASASLRVFGQFVAQPLHCETEKWAFVAQPLHCETEKWAAPYPPLSCGISQRW